MIKNPIIVAIFVISSLLMIFISFYFGVVKYWISYFTDSLAFYMIFLNYPILIGLLYFCGLKAKKAQWISLSFTLLYGFSIYYFHNKLWRADLNNNTTYVNGVIYGSLAQSEGDGFNIKINFTFENKVYESRTVFYSSDKYKIGDSVEIKFSRIHPNVNEVTRLIK